MQNHPKVTVLMAVYNYEGFISESIESILSQSFKDFEFVIVDDASTDNTANIIKSYKDPRQALLIYQKYRRNTFLYQSGHITFYIKSGQNPTDNSP